MLDQIGSPADNARQADQRAVALAGLEHDGPEPVRLHVSRQTVLRTELHRPLLPAKRRISTTGRAGALDALAPQGFAGGPERSLDQRRRLWANGVGLPTAPRGKLDKVKCAFCGERYAPDGPTDHASPHKRHLTNA